MAKVLSFLHVLGKKQIVPSTAVARMSENVGRHLYREISEVTGESMRSIEDKTYKLMRHKLIPDT